MVQISDLVECSAHFQRFKLQFLYYFDRSGLLSSRVYFFIQLAMPSRTITVILNSNHTKKCALLLRSLQAPTDAILHEARNKFRIKGLSQIFLRGGAPLEPDADLGEMAWVTQVWVGKGEPYSGPPSRPAQSGGSGEVRIIAEKSFVDDKAIKQLEQVAELPGVQIAVGMPDLHPGNR
jgi:release factor H-coupled RctB family protein